MNIHHNLEMIKTVAVDMAQKYNVKYNVILMNPNKEGEFDADAGSTYEFVTDSYFEKERPNVIKICTSDEILKEDEDAQKEIKTIEIERDDQFHNKFKEHDIVVSTKDISKIPKGTEGTVVHTHELKLPGHLSTVYEVEFIVNGKSVVETTLSTQIKKQNHG